MELETALHDARARVLEDLSATDVAGPAVVSLVEQAVTHRRWWVEQWPDGAVFLPGLVAQDVQDALLEEYGRWPLCPLHADEGDPHPLSVQPEVGEDPHWVCGQQDQVISAVGQLPPRRADDA